MPAATMTTHDPCSDLRAFALRLRAARSLSGTTPAKLAAHLGVPLARYRSWEAARAIPRQFDVYAKLCRYLGVTVDWLFFGDPSGLPDGSPECLEAQPTVESSVPWADRR